MDGPQSRRLWRDALALAVAWTILALFSTMHSVISYFYEGQRVEWQRLMLASFLDWYTCAIFTPVFVLLVKRYPLARRHALRSTLLYVAVISAVVVLKYAVYVPLRVLLFPAPAPSFRDVLVFGFYTEFLAFTFLVTVLQAVEYYRVTRAQALVTAQLEAKLAEAQLETLRMQLQPHFLFNTLNAISALMYTNPRAADAMLNGLADLLRGSLGRMAAQTIPLRQELATLRDYVGIMQIRFGERLTFEETVDDAALDEPVPHFILQPIVENAIRHGMDDAGPATVAVSGKFERGALVLEVRDAGRSDAPPDFASARGIGLANTRARVERLYGANARVDVVREPGGGTVVRVILPRAAVPA